MSLMKLFRKNNSKVMIGVLLLALVAFVIGPILRQLGRGRGAGIEVVALCAEGEEITNKDIFSIKRINMIFQRSNIICFIDTNLNVFIGVYLCYRGTAHKRN